MKTPSFIKPGFFNSRGFTVQELVVVMAIMSLLLGIATMNLVTIQNRTNLNSQINTMISDTKQQQLKAMIGDTEGRTNPDLYGIHFDTNKYTLFHGSTYNNSDTTNIDTNLDSNMAFSVINVPNQSIIFSRLSGDVYNFNPALSSVTITNSTNKESKTIQFNRYGVITRIN